ncbi:GntR family transcriptional regulator [Oceanobacillus piezotolerans]|uniref:GntR family transcriptional regulator n=1 Tax=Oceanobacillus piezotolerans TaxID=2448030 RepID=A0A498DDT6_9BACI|nr:GntR family transcriptional regulator [Oceanobacillus piezotolerans]RLL41137.1 GntR family transcriptional regulator [Oceanobacillus piezotolerans]
MLNVMPKPLKSQAVESIRNAIIQGVLKNDEMITEKLVKEKFGISRTPFREAIQLLEAQGWVYTVPYTGTYVKPITMTDIDEVFEMRSIIESSIVRFLQERKISIDELKLVMKNMEDRMEDFSDYEFMQEDQAFHYKLYELTNNKRLISVYNQVSDMMLRIGVNVLYKKERRLEVIKEHNDIVKGLENGTGDKEIITHLEKTKKTFISVYENMK